MAVNQEPENELGEILCQAEFTGEDGKKLSVILSFDGRGGRMMGFKGYIVSSGEYRKEYGDDRRLAQTDFRRICANVVDYIT